MAPPTTRIIIFLALALLLASSLVVAVDPSVDKEDAVETCANSEQRIEQVRKENAVGRQTDRRIQAETPAYEMIASLTQRRREKT